MSENSPSLHRKRFPISIRMEPRLEVPPAWYPLVVSLGAIIVALVLGGILITIAGGDAIQSYIHIAKASVGTHSFNGAGLFGRLPHEDLEYRRGRAIYHGRFWSQRRCADPHLPG